LSTFEWLENSGLAVWVGESLWGYPIMISLHAIGLSVVAGVLVMIDMRVLGAFKGMPFSSLRGLMKLAWAGFVVNLISGFSLFSAQATVFIENVPFLIKIPSIFLAVCVAGIMQHQLQLNAATWDLNPPASIKMKVLAVVSIGFWLSAFIAGRLTAYF
jgi:hypothetical protein